VTNERLGRRAGIRRGRRAARWLAVRSNRPPSGVEWPRRPTNEAGGAGPAVDWPSGRSNLTAALAWAGTGLCHAVAADTREYYRQGSIARSDVYGLRVARLKSLVLVPIVVLAAAGLSAVGVLGPRTIDGFTLGSIVKCSPPVDVDAAVLEASCAGDYKRATEALDAREPGHPAIVSIEEYADGTQPGPIDFTGLGVPPTPAPRHPGPDVKVFVFTLADGSHRATGVACSDTCVGIGSYPN
jgi:hypothetical protein